jgi:5-methylcytosine-specific restriction endonuclease McrA
MPIRPENKHRYPPNWREIRNEILRRAEYKCEKCGVRNGAIGYRDEGGEWVDVDTVGASEAALVDGQKCITIVLTIAHLNHTPEDCRPENLRAWCQRCHLNYDRDTHIENRSRGKYEKAEAAGQLRLGAKP